MPDMIKKFYWDVFKEVWKSMEFWNGKYGKWWESIERKKKKAIKED